MAIFITIFLSVVAAIISTLSFFYAKNNQADGNGAIDEIMRLKQQINDMHDKIAKLSHAYNKLSEQYKKLQEVSVNNDMQMLLNTAIKEYNEVAENAPSGEDGSGRHEKERKNAAEKVLKACNEVCERFIAEDLSRNTFASVYKNQLQDILNSDDLKDIYESAKSKYPYIERVLFDDNIASEVVLDNSHPAN